jgi:glyoxylase-like metal-dependent hydrolase (beta-lactamase superfamily II)/rhodanese-related sulfurtransferase
LSIKHLEQTFMVFRQIRSTDGTGTLSYLLADSKTHRGVLIDPNQSDLQKLLYILEEEAVKLVHVIDTHTHADHVSASGELKASLGASLIMHHETKNKWKVVDQGDKFGIGDILRKNTALDVDRFVREGDVIDVDDLRIKVLFTPGHTDNHISLLAGDMVFTGDLLLIGQAGRSDLPGGNTEHQYDSLAKKIMALPDATKIYPGHDYEDNTFSYLREEKIANPFLKPRSKQEYIAFAADFFPPLAENAEGGATILQCGAKRVSNHNEKFKEILPNELEHLLSADPSTVMLDVREPFELAAFGAIPGVVNVPGREIIARIEEFENHRSKAVVVVCQRGNRSYEVAHYLTKVGFTNVYNLKTGTTGWIQSGHPSERPMGAFPKR